MVVIKCRILLGCKGKNHVDRSIVPRLRQKLQTVDTESHRHVFILNITPSICQGIRDLNQQYIRSAISSPTLTHLRFHRHADDDDDRATQRQTLQCFPVGSLWLVINFTVSRGFILGTTFSVHNSLEITVIITIKEAVNVNKAQKHEYRIWISTFKCFCFSLGWKTQRVQSGETPTRWRRALRWTGRFSGSTLGLVVGCSPWKAALVLPASQCERSLWLSSLLLKPYYWDSNIKFH